MGAVSSYCRPRLHEARRLEELLATIDCDPGTRLDACVSDRPRPPGGWLTVRRVVRDRVAMVVPTLPIDLAPRLAPFGWVLDDFEFVDEGRGRALFRSTAHHLFVRLD